MALQSGELVAATEDLILGEHRAAVPGVLERDANGGVVVLSFREAVVVKDLAGSALHLPHDVSFGEPPLLGENPPAGLRDSDARRLRGKKFFGEDYFARATWAPPPLAALAAADGHEMVAEETLRAAAAPPSSSRHAEQVAIDVPVDDDMASGVPTAAKATDAGGRGGNLATVAGIVAASSAVTVVAAGGVSPPVAFAAFVLMLGGLFVAVSGVLEN